VQDENGSNAETHSYEQPRTIDPSLLNRTTEVGSNATSVRRKLLFDTTASRRIPAQVQEDAVRKPKPRNADVLHRALEMGKKIWPLDKMQKILDMVLEPDPYKSVLLGQGHRTGTGQATATSKAAERPNLAQLLENERVYGPSDRDPTVTAAELQYFKGPYIYVYDIEEKLKPIMVREYPKVTDRKLGEWPQFRVASQGRCPFVEDGGVQPERVRAPVKAKEQVTKAVEPRVRTLGLSQPPPLKPVTGKRTLAEMEANRGSPKRQPNPNFARFDALFPHKHAFGAKGEEAKGVEANRRFSSDDSGRENAFMSKSHAKAPRFVAGEPVASGVQPSKLTSAIRSQMISSTSGILGVKAGTSKEIHGLQRKVLQKNSTPAVSQDMSSRRVPDMSHDSNTFIRSTSVSRTVAGRKLDRIHEDDHAGRQASLRRTESAPAPVAEKQKKRDLKPGYCENCGDKFDDFDEVRFA
jgi:regulatory subunit for Cdc7p protein kinase